MKLFYLYTLGCKLNQFDSFAIRQSLLEENWQETDLPEKADLCIVNSCTVTNRSDSQALQTIRKLRRLSPSATIWLTGCYGETLLKDKTPPILYADFVSGNYHKFSLAQQLGASLPLSLPPLPESSIFSEKEAAFFPVSDFGQHARAFVKIQDGCDLRCTYCIVPLVRGNSRSVPIPTILRHIDHLYQSGYREAVLTGIHIGTFGHERQESLLDLLIAITTAIPWMKIRLSSIDSNEVTDELIDFIANHSQIRPHLHIPLQSGSNAILEKMRRRHTREQFIHTMERVHKANSDILIGTDIITGFPGESQKDFDYSLELLQDLPIHHAHIFPFSAKSSTPAKKMAEQISTDIKKERAKQLISIANQKKKQFILSQLGKTRHAIVLHQRAGKARKADKQYFRILTDNYIDVDLQTTAWEALQKKIEPKSEIQVTIQADNKNEFFAICKDS